MIFNPRIRTHTHVLVRKRTGCKTPESLIVARIPSSTINLHTYTHTHSRAYIHTHKHTNTSFADTQKRTRAQTHRHTYTHKHTNTQTRPLQDAELAAAQQVIASLQVCLVLRPKHDSMRQSPTHTHTHTDCCNTLELGAEFCCEYA